MRMTPKESKALNKYSHMIDRKNYKPPMTIAQMFTTRVTTNMGMLAKK